MTTVVEKLRFARGYVQNRPDAVEKQLIVTSASLALAKNKCIWYLQFRAVAHVPAESW